MRKLFGLGVIALMAFSMSVVSFGDTNDYENSIECQDISAHQVECKLAASARDHIVGEGQLAAAQSADSEVVFAKDTGEVAGIMIFRIDEQSIFDLVGLQDGDILTHVEDRPIDGLGTAMYMFSAVKSSPEFTYRVLRSEVSWSSQITRTDYKHYRVTVI